MFPSRSQSNDFKKNNDFYKSKNKNKKWEWWVVIFIKNNNSW